MSKQVSFNQVKINIYQQRDGLYKVSAMYRGKEVIAFSDDKNMYDFIDVESRPFYCREAKTRAYNLIKKTYNDGKN